MFFNSLKFLIFLPCVFFLYWAVPHRFRKYLLLAASWYFYMCWKPEFIVLLLVSSAVDYFCGLGLGHWRDRPARRRTLLAVSLCVNLGLLFFFKYFNFFGETLTALCRAISIPFSVPALEIILPVGISFYTFQTLSYTIDVYRGDLEPECDFVTFALFVSFFPQLVAGPIERAENLLPQLKVKHIFSYVQVTYGAKLMIWGFFKKLVVADRLSVLADTVYNNVGGYSGGALIAATACFALQIYCDFSGYSDIARGCAKMLGVDLMENFKSPYFFSHSIGEYWKRNHISLTLWFRDYVYFPLGGSRKGPWKKALFTVVTFGLSGLWHGAAWTFVIWGLLQAVYLNAEMLLLRGRPKSTSLLGSSLPGRFISILSTFALSCFSLIFFRANSLSDALYVVRHLFTGLLTPVQYCKSTLAFLLSSGKFLLATLAFGVSTLFIFDLLNEKRDAIQALSARSAWVRWPVYIAFTLVLILLIPKTAPAPFIYFQF